MEFTHVTAEKGMTFKRKIDGYIMGNDMYLGLFVDGSVDTIDNYEQVEDVEISPNDRTEIDEFVGIVESTNYDIMFQN